MRVLIAGSGTGGHLFPGVAVAKELSERGHEVHFVGTASGLEARLIPPLGYPLHTLSVGGLKRVGLWRTVKNVLKLPLSALQAAWLILRYWPQAVLGVGGYASGPLLAMAALFLRPVVVIEPNSRPGLTNRLLGRFAARRVVTHFKAAAAYFPSRKLRPLGNPIRREIVCRAEAMGAKRQRADEPLRIFVTGGSQGAHAINEAFRLAAPQLAAHKERLFIRHQSGAGDVAALTAAYRAAGLSFEVTAFIDDMPRAYDEADLVVTRSGSVIAEMEAYGVAALFVPLPTAADDHQTANARELADEGAGWLIPQSEFTPHALAAFIEPLLNDRSELMERAARARALGRPKAAEQVAALLEALAKGKD